MGELHENLREIVDCGLPTALDVIGDKWSFLVLRACYNGFLHFEDFQAQLGIARNILSSRLTKLVDAGILERQPCESDKRRIEYRLTRKGLDLLPAMVALRQWGEKYGGPVLPNPVLVDKQSGQPLAPVVMRSADGRELDYEDLDWAERSDLGLPPSDREGCC
ncbi:winged helix-turn-helix transcriptional regulator [Paraurantiacibacter namhicola]|uniref:Putative HTH-type transcriptional regulator YybR n=1 Tax=Paraurantiacibacter namhicola TaxID=645517 RepID=A0A1C7D4L0_9SPHN|nr:helix-turn-helix domain-containing protein [Paraurantiacibacter namhicola]ANU06406.1 putative HTH-type transcriptional regulator YybR [Paraurantiacibacter namhicola]